MQVLALPASGFQILVPVNMVAQIVGMLPVSTADMEFRSLSGQIRWREYTVPLLKSSELLTGIPGADTNYQRIVILWPIKNTANDAFIALTSLGAPKVIDITDQPVAETAIELTYTLGLIELDSELGVIPDIGALCRDMYNEGQNRVPS